VSAITFAALALLPLTGSAASIIITSGPTAGFSGSVTQNSNTFATSQVTPTQVKVFGNGNYTATGAASVITLSIGGLVSAVATESVSLDYNFNLSFTGSGAVTWTLTSVLAGFFPGPSSTGGPILSTDSGLFTGSKSAVVPAPGGNNIPFTATLTVNWNGATSGDTLAVSIPTNSIDLAVVPEPSSMFLLSLGGLFLARRRR
jgi:hypothetical protein